MNTDTVFCPACQRDVHVTLTPAPVHGNQPVLGDDPELVCLTFGPRCAAGSCPIAGLPSLVMGVRLARSGLDADLEWQTIRMRCDGCGNVTVMDVLDNVHAFCTECHTTNTLFKLDLGEDAVLVTTPKQQ